MRRRLAGAVAVVLALGGACGDDDDDIAGSVPATTVPAPGSAAPTTTGVVPTGFDQTAAVVTLADGTACELCLWVADTDAERARGLMGVTDLGGADGMVFVYTQPTTGNFWMKDTVMPLTIGFFAADGAFVSATDMVPCTDPNPALCARYPPGGPYTHAVEVPTGRLAELGIGPGSHLRLLAGACPQT